MRVNREYTGYYYFMGMTLDVRQQDDELVAAMPYVPAGFEIRMEPAGEDQFRLLGGPMNGGVIAFVRGEDGAIQSIRAGGYHFARITPEALAALPIVERYTAPALHLDGEKERAFAALFQQAINRTDGGWLAYDLPYPKHEFIQYASSQDVIIFHGSNNAEIETFAPVRKSVELRDDSGRGNLQAVYGTHDGLWAMFFAVIDRPNIRGSIRNGVMYFHNQQGETLAIYNFSVNQDQLPEKPWRDGTLYFLPRRSFRRLELMENVYANEWASEEPVQPLAKLHLQPEDFPFLDRVGGHDDSELMRLGELSEAIRSNALSASLEGDHFRLSLPSDFEGLEEFTALQRVYMPAANFSILQSDGKLILEITHLPPAYRQNLQDGYADLL